MICNGCRRLMLEEAGRGRVFYRCGASGRVMESVPQGIYPEIAAPAWCEAGSGPEGPARGNLLLEKVRPEWR